MILSLFSRLLQTLLRSRIPVQRWICALQRIWKIFSRGFVRRSPPWHTEEHFAEFTGNARSESGAGCQAEKCIMVLPTAYNTAIPSIIPSSLYSASRESIMTTSSDDTAHIEVIPPNDADTSRLDDDSGPSRPAQRPTSPMSSITLNSNGDNNMARQRLQVGPPDYLVHGGSRVSVVLPAAAVLQHGEQVAVPPTGSGLSGMTNSMGDFVYPMMPSDIPRYKRKRIRDDGTPTKFKVRAAQKKFSLQGNLDDGWEQVTHPEGQPYFYHKDRHIITEMWLWYSAEMLRISRFVEMFEDFSRSRNLYQPDDTHLVLEITEDDEGVWCGYYYACASTRSVFWLEPFDITYHLQEVKGEASPPHIKHFLEYQYWIHWDLFSNVNVGTIEIFDNLLNIITDARTDVRSSQQSTVNYTAEELTNMAEIVEAASRRFGRTTSTWCIGRFMHLLMKDRFVNFHGQYGARLNQNQSVYGMERRKRSWLIQCISPFLLAAPNVHLEAIEELWTDRLTLRSRCLEFFNKLNTQWGEHIVHASILLNANVAFLAIPSNDPSNNAGTLLPRRTAAQMTSYLSVVASLASMMLGLLLVRQHKTKKTDESASAVDFHHYLQKREDSRFGFELLACVYSLPYALLTWGTLTFALAFLFMCLQISTTGPRVIVSAATGIVCILILCCVVMGWEETDFKWRKRFKEWVKRMNPGLANVTENGSPTKWMVKKVQAVGSKLRRNRSVNVTVVSPAGTATTDMEELEVRHGSQYRINDV